MTATTSAPTFARIAELVGTYVESEHPVSGCERCAKLAVSALAHARVTGSVAATMVEDRRVDGEIAVEHSAKVRKPNASGDSSAYLAAVEELETALDVVVAVVGGVAIPGRHGRLFEDRVTIRREAEIVQLASEADAAAIAIAGVVDNPDRADSAELPDATIEGAKAILRSVSFREDSGAFEPRGLVTALAMIAELDRDATALAKYEVRHLVASTAKAALKGYSLDRSAAANVIELLEDYARAVAVRQLESGALVIGTVTIEETAKITRTPGESPRWTEDVVVEPQTVELVLMRSSSVGSDDWVSAGYAATSVRRETGSTFGGVVVASSEETTPEATTYVSRARGYEAARAIAETGRLLGGRVVLAEGVELVAKRYPAHVSPRSLSWSIRVEGYPAPAKS